ncbi:hypothetical protein PHMEG_0009040 [Phytophthora megakarya]|uniref:Uncharacterized protein n=1 Tax=Phytophthora megakarya TaxID=4795 RepID=A0A225WJP3_9STRA|nr:hypothetical protein PHMEG_0009040 [Phytophthora megakarya]
MPKPEWSPPSSPPRSPPLKTPRGSPPTSPSRDQDNSEIEGSEGGDDADCEELEDKGKIPGGGGDDHDDDGSPHRRNGSTPSTPPAGNSPPSGNESATPPPSPHGSPGGGSPGGTPGGSSPGGSSSGGGSLLQLNPPLVPPGASVPSYSVVRVFTAAEIFPWDPTIVGSVPIIAMIQATLTKRLPIPYGFLYSARMPLVQAPIPRTGYRFELITGANVLALLATEPWLVLRNRPTPLTFDHNLHRRANTPLWRIAVSYAGLEADHLQAYWKSTHYLEITKVMYASDSDLHNYHHDRRQRRIRVGDRWRKPLGACLPMMRNQWDDIDLLLDPYVLHLPTPQDRIRWYPGSVSSTANLTQPAANFPEPTDLITALFECDHANLWRNHFRDQPTDHPSLQIPRLVYKFNPPTDPTSLRGRPPRSPLAIPRSRFLPICSIVCQSQQHFCLFALVVALTG